MCAVRILHAQRRQRHAGAPRYLGEADILDAFIGEQRHEGADNGVALDRAARLLRT
jgi:hypothetical protein